MVELTIVVHISGACPLEWHALVVSRWLRHMFKCTNHAFKAFITRPSVNNVSARLAMKNVAKCDMHRDLQRVEN